MHPDEGDEEGRSGLPCASDGPMVPPERIDGVLTRLALAALRGGRYAEAERALETLVHYREG